MFCRVARRSVRAAAARPRRRFGGLAPGAGPLVPADSTCSSQAARELLDARTLDPGTPALAALETQLRQMLESEAASATRTSASSGRGAIAAVDRARLRRTVAAGRLDVSAEVQTQFVRSIQPMLIHSCATGGCHQPGSAQQLQLDRWALEGNGNPELVRRNLAAVLGAVERRRSAVECADAVGAASAWAAARRRTSRPLAAHQAALLLEWLNEAAGVAPRRGDADGVGVAERPARCAVGGRASDAESRRAMRRPRPRTRGSDSAPARSRRAMRLIRKSSIAQARGDGRTTPTTSTRDAAATRFAGGVGSAASATE